MADSAALQVAQSPAISTAQQDFNAARYSTCLEVTDRLIEAGLDRDQAIALRIKALLRVGKPAEAISAAVGAITEIEDPASRIEAEAQLAVAYASLNDFASAEATFAGIEEGTASTRALDELTYARALIAWMQGDLARAESLLTQTASNAPLVRGRRKILESWIAQRREKYEDHANLMLEGAEMVQSSDVVDIGLLAGAVRAVCTMAREIYVPHLIQRAKTLYDCMDWSGEVKVEQFNASRTLGWAMALQGPDRYFESLRLLHQASSLAPSPAWKVWSLLDRSAMKRYAGELASSSADLYEALDLVSSVNWGETVNDERTGLLYAAEILATIDAAQAAVMLSRFTQIRDSFSTRMAIRGDRLLEATTAYSTGVVQQALNDPKKAQHFFESAYRAYEDINHKWRAGRTALHLYQVTRDRSWHEAAQRQIRDYPNSWIAADIREASTGIGDDGWNRLTPRQREVFNALCEGMTAKRIGERLKCSPNTVRNHIHWVYQAFRVQSQPELITEARKRKLIS
jgi:DNA-binding CsgD family transcriptional regulator/tetratricopeptide (TPR) repeat protein